MGWRQFCRAVPLSEDGSAKAPGRRRTKRAALWPKFLTAARAGDTASLDTHPSRLGRSPATPDDYPEYPARGLGRPRQSTTTCDASDADRDAAAIDHQGGKGLQFREETGSRATGKATTRSKGRD